MDGQVVDVNGTFFNNLEKYNRQASEKRMMKAKAEMEKLRSMLKIDNEA